ncbi:cleavage stimulating factor 64 isoform X1 [Coffea eugenioides]|uniref:cleavage stimulating factor 64 isoform X1 n=1 Tax=Coffea eugenioides TaxID=49369 RepID=UPI000F6060A2|nr:cleavage stimulating factor 64 isoform X1 [Coffea eugenioides]
MATSHPQHRCVFVGNIPYDATEEQLKEICEEVGPVVSFRLVIDRETGKPKGYGFCEYKDEETALSARRNLQGYEINGRQLRVDFAENDKNADRNREQGRGGPGMVAHVDNQKQFGGPAVLKDSSLLQPIGVSVAMTAASIMAQALGAAQTGGMSNQIGIPSQPTLGSDPLTLHLAKMSRSQLIELMSEMKAMATQNKEQARQLLLACPHLPKAILQAGIMLGIVPPHMLQMPNIRQVSAPPLQPLLQDGMQNQLLTTQNVPGLPPLPQNKGQYSLLPTAQEGAISASRPNSMLNNQHASVTQFPIQPQIQLPQPMQNKVLQQNQLPIQSGNPALSLIRPQSQGNFSFRPQIQAAASSSLKHHVQTPPQMQHLGQVTAAATAASIQTSQSIQPPLLDQGFQHGSSLLSGIQDSINKDPRRQVMISRVNDSLDPTNQPSKLVRLNDGRPIPSPTDENMAASASGPSQTFSMTTNQVPKVEEASVSEKQAAQVQLPPDVETALLQQVLLLTPEQVSSLPPDQQQQVIQLQQMLRQAS